MIETSMESFDVKEVTKEINQSKSLHIIPLEMAAVTDLIGLYSEINNDIMDRRMDPKGATQAFRIATTQLGQIKEVLSKIQLEPECAPRRISTTDRSVIEASSGLISNGTSIWSYYRREQDNE